MKKLNQKGFTLIELLAVIAIIAILGLVSVPGVLNSINNSKKASYNILLDNIKTAGINLYEEVDLVGNKVPLYQNNGKELLDEAGNSLIVTIDDNKQIFVNLQTLLSNGFLKGTGSEETNLENSKNMLLLNPMTNEDMGECEIVIKKVVDSNFKVSYFVSSPEDVVSDFCPTSEDLENGV